MTDTLFIHSSTPASKCAEVTGGLTADSALQYGLVISPVINQTATAGYTAVLINATETGTGSGAKKLLDVQVGGVSKFSIDNAGNVGGASFDAKQALVKRGTPTTGATKYFGIPGVNVYGVGTTAGAVGNVYYFPFYVNWPITITNWQFEVTTGPASDANVRIGIYAADGDMQPTGAPLYDSGSTAVATAFTGTKSATGLSVALPPGRYLIAWNLDVALTYRTFFAAGTPIATGMGASPLITRFLGVQAYGAFPNPGTVWTTGTSGATGIIYPAAFKWTE